MGNRYHDNQLKLYMVQNQPDRLHMYVTIIVSREYLCAYPLNNV